MRLIIGTITASPEHFWRAYNMEHIFILWLTMFMDRKIHLDAQEKGTCMEKSNRSVCLKGQELGGKKNKEVLCNE